MDQEPQGGASPRPISREELEQLANEARSMPKRDRSSWGDKVEVYIGSFDADGPKQAINARDLRNYAEAKLPIRSMPLTDNLVEYVARRSKGSLDLDHLMTKFEQQPEPVIVAEHFYGEHKHEVVDGTHTLLAYAAALHMGRRDFILPDDIEPAIQAYVVPPEIWRDFLLDAEDGFRPLYSEAMLKRMSSIGKIRKKRSVREALRTKPPRRWKGRP